MLEMVKRFIEIKGCIKYVIFNEKIAMTVNRGDEIQLSDLIRCLESVNLTINQL